ncbi:MAG: TIGR03560 family F420-dependent LLM class oxidoreductase [Candidatus Binatia bacterium]|nr:TIGR03560 family F420-dependent LLM class oxidoreductase [Candidatus Binatia bacterium]
MSRPIRFGVTLPQIKRSWQQASDAATEFDRLRFDSVWVCDHLYGVPMPNLPILEGWTELAAVAAITKHVGLGTLVTPPFFRNPAVLAKQIATIDQISGGRVIAGLGAGWFEAEFKGYGCEFPSVRERLRALEESVQIMKKMWTEETVTFTGKHASVENVYCEPKPVRPPPILIGGAGEKILMGIVARHADIWNNMAAGQAQLPEKIEAMKRRCDIEGRDFDTLEVSQQCVVIIGADDETAKASLQKATKIYGGHMGGDLEANGIWGTPQGVIDRIGRYVEMGCTSFVIEFFGKDTREPARLFAEKVMPAFR